MQVDIRALAVVGGALATAWLMVRREQERADRSEAEAQRLNALIQDRMVPAMEKANRLAYEAALTAEAEKLAKRSGVA